VTVLASRQTTRFTSDRMISHHKHEAASISWQEGSLTIRTVICSREHMDLYERLRQSEQSRRLAWQVLQEIRQVLEILGDQRIPYEGERKRFRSEGDFLVRALVDVLSQCRFQIGQLECELTELEKLTAEQKLSREVLQALRQLARRPSGVGLGEQELRQRLDQLQELHILPEHRVQPGVNPEGGEETG
jgi:hypothetical protein